MTDTLNPARRWNSFVCPGCRFVFRVPRDHDGKGVVCPACQIMLRLPGQDDVPPPLVTPSEEAADLTEEIEAKEDDEQPAGPGGGDLKFLLGLVVPALLLLGLFAWWMVPDPAKPAVAGPLPAPLPTVPAADATAPPARSLILEVESVVKAFLEAPTPEDLLRHVRDPERIEPRLRTWLAGKPYVAPGFREFLGDSVNTAVAGETMMTVKVRNGDFEQREIVLLGEEGNLKVDWESWAGWSEMTWEDFQRERPVEAKWFRVSLSRVDYYNFDFKDENEWVSYRLDSPDGQNSIYGYVPRAGALDEKIRPIDANGVVKLLLKLRFPPDARSGNQVFIDGVSGHEWVDLAEPENP